MLRKELIEKLMHYGCKVLHEEQNYTVLDNGYDGFHTLSITYNDSGIRVYGYYRIEIYEDGVLFGNTQLNSIEKINHIEVFNE